MAIDDRRYNYKTSWICEVDVTPANLDTLAKSMFQETAYYQSVGACFV